MIKDGIDKVNPLSLNKRASNITESESLRSSGLLKVESLRSSDALGNSLGDN